MSKAYDSFLAKKYYGRKKVKAGNKGGVRKRKHSLYSRYVFVNIRDEFFVMEGFFPVTFD